MQKKPNRRQALFAANAREHTDWLEAQLRRAHDELDVALELLNARLTGVLAAHDRVVEHLAILGRAEARAAARRVRTELRERVAERIEAPLSSPRRSR